MTALTAFVLGLFIGCMGGVLFGPVIVQLIQKISNKVQK